ncbi:type-F conjugative transfer system protein TrbI [Thiotrichales bacterium 19S11-10]|nr:type-F conjugative transfer system protein TrbI [Thiotrichales bacterium 19S11-10]
MINRILELTIAVAISVMASMSFFSYLKPSQPSILSVNLSRIIEDFSKKVAELEGSKDKKNELSEKFAKSLDQAIHDYSEKYHQAIFVSAAVASGTIDITPEIESEVFNKIKLI